MVSSEDNYNEEDTLRRKFDLEISKKSNLVKKGYCFFFLNFFVHFSFHVYMEMS